MPQVGSSNGKDSCDFIELQQGHCGDVTVNFEAMLYRSHSERYAGQTFFFKLKTLFQLLIYQFNFSLQGFTARIINARSDVKNRSKQTAATGTFAFAQD